MLAFFMSIYLFCSAVATTYFAAFLRSRSKADYVTVALFLCLALDIYMFGYAMELNVSALEQKLFWNHIQYIGIPFVSALWLTIAMFYTNNFQTYRIWKILFIFAIPFLSFMLRMTNNWHHLYFVSQSLQRVGSSVFLIKEKGIWLYVQGIHSLVLIIITLSIYIHVFIKRKLYDRGKSVFMIGAAGSAALGLVLNILSKIPIDFLTILLPIAVLFIITSIMKNDLWEAKALARNMVFEKSDEGMILLNNENRIIDFNAAAKTIMENRGIQIRKDCIDNVFTGVDSLSDLFDCTRERIWMVHTENGFRHYCLSIMKLLHKRGTVNGRLITIRDITQMQLLHNQLKMQATTDELSGLLNRRAFTDLCESRLKDRRLQDRNFYLLMIDIDDFKSINDTYGHIVGDRVIEELGNLFRQSFRNTDLIARLGGEEFTVFMQATSERAAYNKAEQFRECVSQSLILVGDDNFHIAISIGLVGTRAKTTDIVNLMNKADKALYASQK